MNRANCSASFGGGSELCDVDGNLRAANTNTETVDESTDDEHGDILGSARDNGTDDPDEAADLDSATTTKLVSQVTGQEGSDEGTTRHGGCDTALNIRLGTRTFLIWISRIFRAVGTLVEEAAVLLSRQAGPH